MKKFVFKRIVIIFLKSLLWLLIPVDLLLIPILQKSSDDTKKLLTPYSVNVNSYQRLDGSYVGSYSRRPPGSVEHDKPLEAKINEMFWGIVFLVIITIISFGILFIYSFEELLNRNENYLNFVVIAIGSQIKLDINSLSNKPKKLINRLISRYDNYKIYSCKICKRNIKKVEFHTSSLATRKPTKICLDCMKIDYVNYSIELEYVKQFDNLLQHYINEFNSLNQLLHPDCIVQIEKIKKTFYKSVKEIRMKKEL